ncbi:putative vitellogenin receptor [Oppia nitens]|uniref:putative vitellogenin receptor n=1 Tax=Oppia nitens TaxID=1686743 RepID=UPI0023DB14E8|nr:putative vitellogenin receptor [Oppia nitens]
MSADDRVDALAVDWINHLAYLPVCDKPGNRFGLMAVNITAPAYWTQLTRKRHKCSTIVKDILVDPNDGLVFWTEFSISLNVIIQIMRLSQDNTDILVIGEDRDALPKSLTLDIHSKRLCWLNRLKQQNKDITIVLVCMKYDGTGKQVYTGTSSYLLNTNPCISVMNGNIYWSNKVDNTIKSMMVAIDGSNQTALPTNLTKIFVSNIANIAYFKIISLSQQPNSMIDRCLNHNCSHMCVPTFNVSAGYTCLCSLGHSWTGSQCLNNRDLPIKRNISIYWTIVAVVSVAVLLICIAYITIYHRNKISPKFTAKFRKNKIDTDISLEDN